MAKSHLSKPRPGYRLIFCRSFRHYRTGKQVYRKDGGMFAFWVRDRSR